MKPKKKTKNGKGRLNLRIPAELDDFIKEYAERHEITVTKIVVDHFKLLREKETHVPQC